MTDAADPAFTSALSLARAALAAYPAGVFADFDGTLSPVVRDPMAARLAPGGADALRTLARRLAVVCIVTGRAAADVRRMTDLSEVFVAGNHGIEWLAPGEATPELAPALASVPEELARLLRSVPDLPGLWKEDKRLSATVHYRNASDPTAARSAILAALAPALEGVPIELREGRLSVELRPMGAGDKGTAVRALASRYALRGLVVLGDDVTDLDMFQAAVSLREEGVASAIIAVGGGGEVPPEVAARADAVLPDPVAVVRLLAQLASDR